MVSWQPVGAAMGVFDMCARYAKERQQFGTPIGGFQLVRVGARLKERKEAQAGEGWEPGRENENTSCSMAMVPLKDFLQPIHSPCTSTSNCCMRHYSRYTSIHSYPSSYMDDYVIRGLLNACGISIVCRSKRSLCACLEASRCVRRGEPEASRWVSLLYRLFCIYRTACMPYCLYVTGEVLAMGYYGPDDVEVWLCAGFVAPLRPCT